MASAAQATAYSAYLTCVFAEFGINEFGVSEAANSTRNPLARRSNISAHKDIQKARPRERARERGSPGRLSEPNIVTLKTAGPAQS
jgi:hypothetical protein